MLASALLLGLLPACREDVPSGSPPASVASGLSDCGLSAADLIGTAFDHSGREDQDGLEGLYARESREELTAYARNAYQIEDDWEDMAMIRATGASAFEIAVVLMEDDSAAVRAAAAFMNYITVRQGDFAGYAPAEADMAAGGEIFQSGAVAALFICPNPKGARTAVESALNGEPLAAPGFEDTKDDPAGLSEYDQNIYDAAKEVLNGTLEDGMSDYEKEIAIYGWVVENVDYDWSHQDRMDETPRESFTPYGGLVERKAVCLGFAATFQLLMDLAGVECITVVGASHNSTSDHTWNMVRLNGAWYCVDVTWDATTRQSGGRGQLEYWDYFNITSDEMADSDHQWDYAGIPEATTKGLGRE